MNLFWWGTSLYNYCGSWHSWHFFLQPIKRKKKDLKTEVVGKRKREIGLVVPAKYAGLTNNIKFAQVLVEKHKEKQRKNTDITIHKPFFKNFLAISMIMMKRKRKLKFNNFRSVTQNYFFYEKTNLKLCVICWWHEF